MKCILTLLIVLLMTGASAQTADTLGKVHQRDLEVGFSSVTTTLLGSRLWGVNPNLKYFPDRHWGIGIYAAGLQRKIPDTFRYSIKSPVINYSEIGILNQLNLAGTQKAECHISLLNAFASSRLGDAFEKKQYGRYRMAKEIETSYFYTLEPGAGLSFRIIPLRSFGGIWLTADAQYRFAFGNSEYAAARQFRGWSFGLGISVKRQVSNSDPF